MNKATTCHIIGSGLSGLACAFFIKQYAPDMHSIIYERRKKLGGNTGSFYDADRNINLNNNVFLISRRDGFLQQFVKKSEWLKHICFMDIKQQQSSMSLKHNINNLCQSICGLKFKDIAPAVGANIIKQFRPSLFSPACFYVSVHDFDQRITNVLASHADEIRLSSELTKIIARQGRITSLYFGAQKVTLGNDDKVIFAVDNHEATKFLNVAELEYLSSTNIIFHTSQTVFLPQGVSLVCPQHGISDLIATGPNIIAAQINGEKQHFSSQEELVMEVWKEISQIRGVNSPFMPPYRVCVDDKAILKLNRKNNSRRPDNAFTNYHNAFICGGWTMKDFACTPETSVLSAERAIRSILTV